MHAPTVMPVCALGKQSDASMQGPSAMQGNGFERTQRSMAIHHVVAQRQYPAPMHSPVCMVTFHSSAYAGKPVLIGKHGGQNWSKGSLLLVILVGHQGSQEELNAVPHSWLATHQQLLHQRQAQPVAHHLLQQPEPQWTR